ncbi:efflux RND transporter periplasmic adaptor subunit [Luteirhabdus pelagi]|uniref:efflux RND transporter periplasmic adaptor subunit n=1 Tax=Luteirhabdus pelagi TaxID=2792783 RepID=UPI00193A692B|nr:efflux RND transporter periplasmic adaptor subunit [Luteirhabdus pelagi]
MSKKKIVIISLGILVAAALVTFLIFMTEPTAKSEGATKETAMLVNYVEAEKGTFTPTIVATGTVQAVEDVMISPLVSGQIIRRADGFVPGGNVKEGEVLLQIDPSDYRNTVALRRSELSQAKTDLQVEMGRQKIAEQDLQLIGGDSLSSQQKDLVLRQPQLEAVRATIESAEAGLSQAQLNLNRTTIRAPFDAHIIRQNVTIGSQVAPGDNLGRLVGTDYYWVTVTVPIGKLKYLQFPDANNDKGASVRIQNTSSWEEDEYRTGYLDKQVGALDNQTRLARVLVKVPDPLGYESGNSEKPIMIIGAFVETQIEGKPIENVVRIDRGLVRSNETVWVMQEGKLSVRDVNIQLQDSKYAYISEGLNDKDKIVTTNLSTVADGIPLRTEGSDSTQVKNSRQE